MRRVLSWLFISLTLVACSASERRAPSVAQAALSDALMQRALTGYAELALAVYEDSVAGARELHTQVEALVKSPSAGTLLAAQEAWLAARVAYSQSEVYRFYDGPIDTHEVAINTWPIDESYVDHIVQDVARHPVLTTQLIAELNARDGETSISTGYHVLEFLLWGRDENAEGPGKRDPNDFLTSDKLAARRGEYLELASALLLAQLTEVRDAWRDGPMSFRAKLLQKPYTRGVYWALKGMGKLSGPELSGERMTVPYETKDQENEHSCFSDSTGADLLGNARGILNVCTGRYLRTNGKTLVRTGMCELLRSASPELGKALTSQIEESVKLVGEIPQPFDRAILGTDEAPARKKIARAIASLRSQAQQLEQLRQQLSLDEPAVLVKQP